MSSSRAVASPECVSICSHFVPLTDMKLVWTWSEMSALEGSLALSVLRGLHNTFVIPTTVPR